MKWIVGGEERERVLKDRGKVGEKRVEMGNSILEGKEGEVNDKR
ncbi:hypothetical protein [Paenibacillus xylanexedens]|nr:hypothetical protein [Paenibacillus xylanexedens]